MLENIVQTALLLASAMYMIMGFFPEDLSKVNGWLKIAVVLIFIASLCSLMIIAIISIWGN